MYSIPQKPEEFQIFIAAAFFAVFHAAVVALAHIWLSKIHYSWNTVSKYFKLFRDNGPKKIVRLYDFWMIIITENNKNTYNNNILLPCSCTLIPEHLTHILPLKICYMCKFIQINTNLWLVDCTLAICSKKCEMRTTFHQKMSLEDAKFPPCLTHLPQGECYGLC